jgi:hypothetical protein
MYVASVARRTFEKRVTLMLLSTRGEQRLLKRDTANLDLHHALHRLAIDGVALHAKPSLDHSVAEILLIIDRRLMRCASSSSTIGTR